MISLILFWSSRGYESMECAAKSDVSVRMTWIGSLKLTKKGRTMEIRPVCHE